ncbi:MAG: sulfurtransferase [Gammaproteobacteria bacterium]|nr:sulfurtransferase [Gammaproteobacteria bacterium]
MSFTTLVSTSDLAAHLDDPDWVVIDCRFTLTDPGAGLRSFQEGHIPGARYANLNDDLSSPVTETTGRHPLPDVEALAAKLGQWGIDGSKQVVVYDDTFGAMAGRLWWLLKWMGHDKVALLDGVYPKWLRENRPVSAVQHAARPVTFVPSLRDQMLVSADQLQEQLAQGNCVLIDARSEERFTGEIEPLDKVAGHVPGAVNRPYDDNLDFSGELMTGDELREEFEELLGERPSGCIIHMCGSGVTACHNILAMEAAGLMGSRLYVGSWSEWITDSSRAIATGD